MQNGQTEPAGVTRRRTLVRREVKFVRRIKHFNSKIRFQTNFHLYSCFYYLFCFIRSVHFIAASFVSLTKIVVILRIDYYIIYKSYNQHLKKRAIYVIIKIGKFGIEVIGMENLIIPKNYKSLLSLRQTEIAIKKVKDFFERDLAVQLNLTRVSAPLFVGRETGLNDNLNGTERPVSFDIKTVDGEFEIVHSLAKWKRYALKRYNFQHDEGLYTDMNAIRRDEDPDNLHSFFVDQWDWEKVIDKSERNEETLKHAVRQIFRALKHTEKYISDDYNFGDTLLPSEISFVTTQELEDMYPNLSPKERETAYVKEKGAAFIMKIGGALKSGKPHDGRAPDYDDWELNGDIIVYYPVLDTALELSSMGIRVDEEALLRQLKIRGREELAELPFQKALLNRELPYTIGGGIGQSRICMFFLRKVHVGEVQSSVWPEEMIRECEDNGIILL